MALTTQFSQFGDLDVLHVVDQPPPEAGPGEVRLRVKSAGINPLDWKLLAGYMTEIIPLESPARRRLRLPTGLGSDVAGVVDQVGADVTAFKLGDDVLGQSLSPSFAQHALADPGELVAKPRELSWEVAGSLAGAGGTAWAALNRLGVADGETLLIHAASGGVGTFAAQIARARGVRVIGTAGAANLDYLRDLGVVPVPYGDGLAERVRQITPDGVDAVLDASGRGEIPMSIELAGGPSRVLTLVAFDAADTGIQVHAEGPGNPTRALQEMLDLLAKDQMTVEIAKTYQLFEVATALEENRRGHARGKAVLLPN